jgi:hypothetical protein
MRSKLAEYLKQSLLESNQRLTPEQRLEAFLVHSRLVMELHRAGREARATLSRRRS